METAENEDFAILNKLALNLRSCILGKEQEIDLLLTALLSQGHVLLEDVPGTGKTVLIKALARSIRGQYHRIQCNPDLLPTDITGVAIYHPKQEAFIYRPGPVMTHILLIDEINRATTKTQSALLEAMEERHVSVDGESHALPHPFMLLATQNPIDFEGTYSLPEAQLDRFLLKFSLGYPDEQHELDMIKTHATNHPLTEIQPVTDIDKIVGLQQKAAAVHMDEAVSRYAVTIVRKTREHRAIQLGASPRASLSIVQAAKSYALLQERDYVIPDDIKFLVPYVLGHRTLLYPDARLEGQTVSKVLGSILEETEAPVRLEK